MNKTNLLVIAELTVFILAVFKTGVVVKINHVIKNPSLMGNFW